MERKESKLVLGYNTNGFYHHSLNDAIKIIADLGYGGIAVTPDVHHLNPFSTESEDLDRYRALLEMSGLRVVVETGARYILDAEKKHYPSLLTPGRGNERLRFLKRCVEIAQGIGAAIMSIHSGNAEGDATREQNLAIMAGFLDELLVFCEARSVHLALEPEPGMFIESMTDYDAVKGMCRNDGLCLTLDIGHVHITEKESMAEVVQQYSDDLVNVHLDDAANGVHEHLPFGEGEINFETAMGALKRTGREIFLSVELSRHGHEAVKQATLSKEFFDRLL